jgi:competence protein ComEC
MLYNIGFQMSIGALFGISILFEPIKRFFSRFLSPKNAFLNFIVTSLSLTFSVSIIVSPVVAYYFYNYSVISPVANLFVIPLITLVLLFSILAVIFSYIYIPVAILFAADTDFILYLIAQINAFLSNILISPVNDLIVPLAVVISFFMIYIFYSMSIRQLFFRMGMSLIGVILFFITISKDDKPDIHIFPRRDIVVIEINQNNSNVFLLIERREKIRIRKDFALLKYILSKTGENEILYTGETGEAIAEGLSSYKQFKILYVSLPKSVSILKHLGSDFKIIQNIDI